MAEIKHIIRTKKFEKEVKSVKNPDWKEKIKNNIVKVIEKPDIGKPLRYELHGEKSIRIGPYRMIYSVEKDTLFLLRFEHRKKVYK